MADVRTLNANVSDSIQDIVVQEVQQILSASLVMPGALKDYSAQAVPGLDTIKIPRMTAFTVTTVTPGSNIDSQAINVSTDNLDLNQFRAIHFLVQDIANLQSNVSFVQEAVQQAAKDIAISQDAFLIDMLESGASAAAPDHRLAYVGGSIAAADILAARAALNVQNVPMDGRALVISPGSEAALMAISSFVRVDESGSDSALRNGMIGKLYGFNVLMSSQAEDLKSLAFHQSAGAYASQMAVAYETQRELATQSTRHALNAVWGGKILDSGKRVVMLGTAA